ncbi:hypothetical protein OF83DRAFT_227410 [Amylostereum chailletii]|nr:hypothetical protein OF83DRAFT_227410 [Amylostereum chailletii]
MTPPHTPPLAFRCLSPIPDRSLFSVSSSLCNEGDTFEIWFNDAYNDARTRSEKAAQSEDDDACSENDDVRSEDDAPSGDDGTASDEGEVRIEDKDAEHEKAFNEMWAPRKPMAELPEELHFLRRTRHRYCFTSAFLSPSTL